MLARCLTSHDSCWPSSLRPLFLSHCEGSRLAPLSLFWYVHVCRFPWWLSLGLFPRPSLFLVAFDAFVRVVLFFLVVSCCLFFRDVPFPCSPPFGLFLVVCGWVALWRLPSLPSPWRMAVLTSGSAGPTLCCLRLGIWLLPQRPECLACWYCFLLSGAVTGWSRDGVCPVSLSSSCCMATKASALCGALPSTPCCACRLCFSASALREAPRHHSLCRSAACVPPLWRILLSSLSVLLCLSWALLLSAASVFGVFRFWRGLFLCLVLFVCVLAVLSPLRLIQ